MLTFTDTERLALPRGRVDETQLDGPAVEFNVGDIVATYSRGSVRLVQIAEVKPTRVLVAYSTEGAWKEATRIVENYLALDVDAQVRGAEKQAGKNYDYYVEASTAEYAAAQLARWWHMTPERAEHERAEHEQWLAEHPSRDEYVAGQGAECRARCEAAKTKARERGVAAHLNVTEKWVKKTDVFAIKHSRHTGF